jgi:hypothetical protein
MRCGFTIPVEADHPQRRERAGKLEEGFHLDMRSRLHREVVIFAWARPASSESGLPVTPYKRNAVSKFQGFRLKREKLLAFGELA